jgi:rhamnulokinase
MRTALDRVVAVDLGASSGRVYALDVGADDLTLTEVARFPNGAVDVAGALVWDILGLYRGILDGLRAAGEDRPVRSVGIDSWAVDYGIVDPRGRLMGQPVSHRDARTADVAAELTAGAGAAELYRRTGIALHRFNTIFQLAVDQREGRLAGAGRILLIPDLLNAFLTGVEGTERTNASTTGLVGLDGDWDAGLLRRIGVSPALLAPIHEPGARIGVLRPVVAAEMGTSAAVEVLAVASHDTASAVVGVPAEGPDVAYLSCGTWSLLGLELAHPVVSEEARRAGFTNEAGLNGTVRFLRNVMGLWLHQQSVRTWERTGGRVDLSALSAAAAAEPPLASVIDPDDPRFLPPGDMPGRIAVACAEQGQAVPLTPAAVTRCILDSLALAYRRSLHQAESLAGRRAEVVHIVGGGVNNRLLCQLTADACDRPVVAGPVEAAAMGNGLVQARALGLIPDAAGELRRRVAAHSPLVRYQPDPLNARRFAAWRPATGVGPHGSALRS